MRTPVLRLEELSGQPGGTRSSTLVQANYKKWKHNSFCLWFMRFPCRPLFCFPACSAFPRTSAFPPSRLPTSCCVIKMFMADVCCHKNAKLSGLPLRMRLLDDQKGHSAVAIVVLLLLLLLLWCRVLVGTPLHVCVCASIRSVFMALCLLITFAASAFHLWRNAPKGWPTATSPRILYG